jgi:hypothetical protein
MQSLLPFDLDNAISNLSQMFSAWFCCFVACFSFRCTHAFVIRHGDRSTNYQTREDYNDEAVLHHDKAWMEGRHDSSEAHPCPSTFVPKR